MEFLKALEGIRVPILDKLLQAVSYGGEELVFMAVALVVFWCVDKWRGYFVLAAGFVGTILSQFLKIACQVPRPWVREPGFTVVESAKAGATGYSFPSGHSQSAACTFGAIAWTTKRAWVRWTMIALALLVGFSRMYLGAHYPSDVAVGLLIGLISLAVIHPVIRRAQEDPKVMVRLIGCLLLLALGNLAYVLFWKFPADAYVTDEFTGISNQVEALKNAWTLLGCLLGLTGAYAADRKYNFSVEAPLAGQICKVVLGLALIILIRSLLKKLFGMISDDVFWNAPRYCCMVLAAGALWPRTFSFWAKVGKKKQ